MSDQPRILVTGAGGFSGHHLVSFLKARGAWVRGVDLKRPEYAPTSADEFELLDLRLCRHYSDEYGIQTRIARFHNILGPLGTRHMSRRHVPGPVGVRGRNSDNTCVRHVLDWVPRVSLEDGLRQTDAWIETQVRAELQRSAGQESTIAAA